MPNRSQQTTQPRKTRRLPIAGQTRAALSNPPRPLAAWRLALRPCRDLSDARSMPPSDGTVGFICVVGHKAGPVTGQRFIGYAENPYVNAVFTPHITPNKEVSMAPFMTKSILHV